MRRNTWIQLAAVSAALAAPAASMAQVDTSGWKCEYCPFDKEYRAEIDAGVSYVGGENGYRYGNGTGYDDEGVYGEFGANGGYAGERYDASWKLENLGLDSRSAEIEFSRAGTFDARLSYDRTPYRLFGSTRTAFTRNGTDYTLPAGWVPAGNTAGFTQLGAALFPVQIGSDRDVLGFGATYRPVRGVRLYVDYRHQERDGIRIVSGANFTNAALLPRVIDDQTDEVDIGVRYAVGGLNLVMNWYGSFYSDGPVAITWQNPFTPIPGADVLRLATEPDNDFQQIALSGVYRAGVANTVIAFSAAAGQGTQDDYLLPYTSNATLAAPALPATAVDGKVDTTNYALTVTSRPFSGARVKLSYRFDKRDNQTPVSTWTRVITDSFATNDAEQNVPYSFERARLRLSGSYRLFDTVTVSGGYDRTDIDRDLQEVASQTEDTGWGKLRWRPTAYLEATFKGGASQRDIDEYDTDLATSLGQNPLLRKYNLAYRYREFGEVSLQASLPQQPLSVGMTYLYADDSYSQSDLGMTDSEENHYTFDVSWSVSEAATLYVTAGNESIEATQLGSETLSGPMWSAAHDDDFSHLGTGFRLTGLAEKMDLGLDYTHSRGESDILVTGMAVTAAALPTLETDLDSLHLSLGYRISERLAMDVVLRYESFNMADWSLDGVRPATIPSVLTLGASSYDYDIWAVGVGFRYRAGK